MKGLHWTQYSTTFQNFKNHLEILGATEVIQSNFIYWRSKNLRLYHIQLFRHGCLETWICAVQNAVIVRQFLLLQRILVFGLIFYTRMCKAWGSASSARVFCDRIRRHIPQYLDLKYRLFTKRYPLTFVYFYYWKSIEGNHKLCIFSSTLFLFLFNKSLSFCKENSKI